MGNVPWLILALEYFDILVQTDKSYKHTKIKYIPTEFSNGFFASHTRNAKPFNTLPSFVTRRRRQVKFSGTDRVRHIVYPFCSHFKHLTSRFWTGWYSSFHTNFYFLEISVNYEIKFVYDRVGIVCLHLPGWYMNKYHVKWRASILAWKL